MAAVNKKTGISHIIHIYELLMRIIRINRMREMKTAKILTNKINSNIMLLTIIIFLALITLCYFY